MIYRPPVHMIQYGDAYGGKSTAAATFPKPQLVCLFDSQGKEMPYIRAGVEADRNDDGTIAVYDASGEQIIRIEPYHDLQPENPTAWSRFRKRVTTLSQEMNIWKTITLDSVTLAEIAARYESQFKLNKESKDPRQWYAYSTEELERLVMVRLGALPCNVVLCMHIDEVIVQDANNLGGVSIAIKDNINGIRLASAAAPGRLRKRLPAGYNTLVRTFIRVEGGQRRYLWQGQADNTYNAGSNCIELPALLDAHYDNLWEDGV